jgi:hypothetical protein
MEGHSERGRKMKKLLSLALALAFVLIGSPNVMAGNTFCPSELLILGDVDGNLVVDGPCSLFSGSAEIGGNVTVLDDGTLTVFSPAVMTVDGNIDVKPGGALAIFGTPPFFNVPPDQFSMENFDVVVEGNIKCKDAISCGVTGTVVWGNIDSKGSIAGANFVGNIVDGNVKANNNADGVAVIHNLVLGNVEVNRNSFAPAILFNNIGGNLECKDNVIDPPFSLSNTVLGKDKCFQ